MRYVVDDSRLKIRGSLENEMERAEQKRCVLSSVVGENERSPGPEKGIKEEIGRYDNIGVVDGIVKSDGVNRRLAPVVGRA